MVDIWNQKSSCDFLHYLKFELMQYCFLGSYFMTCIIIVSKIRGASVNGTIFTEEDLAVGLFGLAHALQLVLLSIKLYRREKV